MKFRNSGLVSFDRQFPIYNFFFPAQGKQLVGAELNDLYEDQVAIRSRALYFHVPFCETVCSFCPFTRGKFENREQIDSYVDALLGEISLKARMIDLKAVPVHAIFFGGGTPSLLAPSHIERIGRAIQDHFDLSALREFSFEIEVKSIDREKIAALRSIGVSHPRFGLQTFDPEWRKLFNLTSTIEQIENTAELLIENFPVQSFDILYGMNGQDEGQLLRDLERAAAIGTTNVDVYPIDNVMTQVKLHRAINALDRERISAPRKFSMSVLVDQAMRQLGFMPHNGHGYFRAPASTAVVSNAYSFAYHESVYGYHDYDLLGFGTNAISSSFGFVVTNIRNRAEYIRSISAGVVPYSVSRHDVGLDYARPVILRLPYHGVIEKARVEWNQIPDEVLERFRELCQGGLIEESDSMFSLTKRGWYWYVNMMYFMMPRADQAVINRIVHESLRHPERKIERREILMV